MYLLSCPYLILSPSQHVITTLSKKKKRKNQYHLTCPRNLFFILQLQRCRRKYYHIYMKWVEKYEHGKNFSDPKKLFINKEDSINSSSCSSQLPFFLCFSNTTTNFHMHKIVDSQTDSRDQLWQNQISTDIIMMYASRTIVSLHHQPKLGIILDWIV